MATKVTKQAENKTIIRDGFTVVSKGSTRAQIIIKGSGTSRTHHLRRSGLNTWTDNAGRQFFI